MEDNSKLHFLIDSGTTQHMTLYKEILQEITPFSKQISATGNHILNAIGEGDIIIMDSLWLTNVLLAPDLQDSLLSIAAINNHGYDIIFTCDGVVTIKDVNKTIAQGYWEGNLYYLQLHSQTPIEDNTKSIPNLMFKSCYTFKANDSILVDTYWL